MFDNSDPRAKLAWATPSSKAGGFFGADYARFYEEPPQEQDVLGRHWYVRGQNFIVAYSEVAAGAVLARHNQADEYVVILRDHGTTIEVSAANAVDGSTAVRAVGPAVVMVPPGPSTLTVLDGGQIVRLLSYRASDLLDLAVNHASYATPHPAVAPLDSWPEPVGGWRVRVYDADVPEVEGRLGRIWCCTTFMLNWFGPKEGPRDPTKLSPHHHDDFEQCSLTLDGDWIQHMRWPWTPDIGVWREDEHAFCSSPSVTIIPPPAIHTSQWVGAGTNSIVDVFCPPRRDFAEMGWVLNADDYPAPAVEQSS